MSTKVPPPSAEDLLTVEEVARLLKTSKRTIWRWLAEKRLPEPIRYTRVCIRWKVDDIQAFLQRRSETKE